MKNKGKILALDFGEKSVGVAISDVQRTMIFGRGVIKNFKSLAGLFEQIGVLCKAENVSEVVFGLPVSQEGEDTPQTERIRNIGEKLEDFLSDVPVVFEDESFTSFEADEMLAEAGVEGRKVKRHQDELAAMIILKRHLGKSDS